MNVCEYCGTPNLWPFTRSNPDAAEGIFLCSGCGTLMFRSRLPDWVGGDVLSVSGVARSDTRQSQVPDRAGQAA